VFQNVDASTCFNEAAADAAEFCTIIILVTRTTSRFNEAAADAAEFFDVTVPDGMAEALQ